MSRPITIIKYSPGLSSSEVIDVRSPSEFELDHIPGAVNLPVLNDAERAQVGTIYKQVSAFEARKLGSSLIAANVSRFLGEHFRSKDPNYSALVYCWRGGKRSKSLASVLTEIGWQVLLLDGGYKSFRAWVLESLEAIVPTIHFHVLTGLTGSGKTELLRQLQLEGAQVLDLEGAANHRGSLLGDDPRSPQPAQKYFESQLATIIAKFDLTKPVWVESESARIGKIQLPKQLLQQIRKGLVFQLDVPRSVRAAWSLESYRARYTDEEVLEKLALLVPLQGHERVTRWRELYQKRDWLELSDELLQFHYDPAYSRALKNNFPTDGTIIRLQDLTASTIREQAKRLHLG